MKLVFATNNQNKIKEIQQKISDKFTLLSLEDINFNSEPEETGTTFRENALIKAKSIWNQLHINCFAEDSGLVIDSLNGEPGINSSHYSGERNNKKNIEKVLLKLAENQNRKAYFNTTIALILEGKEYFFEGQIEGQITHKPIGENGFGYDPIFIPTGFNKTFAQMTKEEKNTMSHRGIATEKLMIFLQSYGN